MLSKQLVIILVLLVIVCPFISRADVVTPLRLPPSSSLSYDLNTTTNHFTVDTVKNKENKKLIAALLALPLPLGVVGAHRIYLGTEPVIPLAYIVTIGGCFGVLPLIDLVVILSASPEELQIYMNNKKMFMWVK